MFRYTINEFLTPSMPFGVEGTCGSGRGGAQARDSACFGVCFGASSLPHGRGGALFRAW